MNIYLWVTSKVLLPWDSELEKAEWLTTRVISTLEFSRERAKDSKFHMLYISSECWGDNCCYLGFIHLPRWASHICVHCQAIHRVVFHCWYGLYGIPQANMTFLWSLWSSTCTLKHSPTEMQNRIKPRTPPVLLILAPCQWRLYSQLLTRASIIGRSGSFVIYQIYAIPHDFES